MKRIRRKSLSPLSKFLPGRFFPEGRRIVLRFFSFVFSPSLSPLSPSISFHRLLSLLSSLCCANGAIVRSCQERGHEVWSMSRKGRINATTTTAQTFFSETLFRSSKGNRERVDIPWFLSLVLWFLFLPFDSLLLLFPVFGLFFRVWLATKVF